MRGGDLLDILSILLPPYTPPTLAEQKKRAKADRASRYTSPSSTTSYGDRIAGEFADKFGTRKTWDQMNQTTEAQDYRT